jgi:acetyltransferase-like isoleucine patch superfamily enzyme
VIEPFTFIGRGATIGGNCTLGPFASIQRDSIVPEGTTLSGNLNPQSTILNTGLMNTSV